MFTLRLLSFSFLFLWQASAAFGDAAPIQGAGTPRRVYPVGSQMIDVNDPNVIYIGGGRIQRAFGFFAAHHHEG